MNIICIVVSCLIVLLYLFIWAIARVGSKCSREEELKEANRLVSEGEIEDKLKSM